MYRVRSRWIEYDDAKQCSVSHEKAFDVDANGFYLAGGNVVFTRQKPNSAFAEVLNVAAFAEGEWAHIEEVPHDV